MENVRRCGNGMVAGVVVLLLVSAGTGYGAVPRTITDENFNSYAAGAVYTDVNPWGWTAVPGNNAPKIANSWNVSSPSSLIGPSYLNFAMQNMLTGNDVLNAANGAGDVTFSMWLKARNAYNSPVILEVGELANAWDRTFFKAGGNSWTYKYFAGGYHDLLDFNGQPLQVPHGDDERFNQIVLKFVWDSVAGNYGSTYQVQIFDNDGSPRSPLTTVGVYTQDNGVINLIDGFKINATAGNNDPRWIDDLKINVVPEPATLGLLSLGLTALLGRRRLS